jgi:hypothetical protein
MRHRRVAIASIVVVALAMSAGDADAQRRRRKRGRKPPPAAPAAAPAAAPTPAPPTSATTTPATAPKKGKDQTFDFTGIELAGSMRMPQLLYFLDRADEELERASLERRSFVPAMVRSIDEENL